MTGRDFIVYILTNHLEDEPIFKDGELIGFMSEQKMAETADVGVGTVRAWIELGVLNTAVKIGGVYYLPIISNN